MTFDTPNGLQLLHTPGPTHLPAPVLQALITQPTDLEHPQLAELVARCEAGLKQVFATERAEVFSYMANGHGAWEAALANLVPPGGKVLVAGSGYFAEVWGLYAEEMGVSVVRTPTREGLPLDPAAVEAALRADTAHDITAVFAVHTDTASGLTSDIPAVRAAIDAAGHPALLVVDVIASLGATRFRMDDWGVNVALAASQKALMLPAGLAFVAADDKALAVARTNPTPRAYWAWERRRSELLYRKFCGTTPHNLLNALAASLTLILGEGLDAVFARHARVARAVHAAVDAWSQGGVLSFNGSVPATRAASVTAICVADGFEPNDIRRIARERFHVSVAGGLGPRGHRMFRIGHLGDVDTAAILGCLGGLEATFRTLSLPVGEGAMPAAIAALGSR